MVESVVDPVKVPTITLSQAELDDIRDLMAAGQLPEDYLQRHHEAVRANVFGHDYKTDAQGEPLEQGFGSAGNQTQNSINAYKKYAKYESDFSEEKYNATLKRMESELATSDKRRAAERAAAAKKPARRLDAPRRDI
jgi:hypothetical protein